MANTAKNAIIALFCRLPLLGLILIWQVHWEAPPRQHKIDWWINLNASIWMNLVFHPHITKSYVAPGGERQRVQFGQ